MRRTRGREGSWRVAAIAVIALAVALVAPAMASAAPHSTLNVSTHYMVSAKPFTISGKMYAKYAGTYITVEIRKPGRTYWDQVASVKIPKSGLWSYRYTPKLGGKFFIRSRYRTGTSGLSRTETLTVKRGPGVKTVITLSSTTSTRDSGLFERLGPAFMAACPEYSLKANFVGSGAAIAAGGTGDADVLLTHSPAAEVDFMKGIVAGAPSAYHGLNRYKVMYNDFVLVGPKSNPAGIETTDTAIQSFQKIATTGSTFWSRNDNSGTNAKEKEIWALLNPANPQIGQSWYKASGTMGMAQALAAANDSGTSGYTLADRATWLNASTLKTVGNLQIVNSGDLNAYINQYAVIEVAGARNREGAQDFSNWIRCPQAQALIRSYGEYTYPGQIMFVPNAGPYPWK